MEHIFEPISSTLNVLLRSLHNNYEDVVFLDSHKFKDHYGKYDRLLAFGTARKMELPVGNAFNQLNSFILNAELPVFFALSYDLKNELEELASAHLDVIQAPAMIAFEPLYVIYIKDGKQYISQHTKASQVDFSKFHLKDLVYSLDKKGSHENSFICQIDEKAYLNNFSGIKERIQFGDIYEMNYCINYTASNLDLDVIATFCNLQIDSPSPFGAFCKFGPYHIISSSPERFLSKKGSELISQPIKGTAKRNGDLKIDEQIALQLKENKKEQNENVMIVDLVRNDLSKVAQKSSVKVVELFGIYGFAKVFQMISTISAQLKPGNSSVDAIKACFPMGSMTGAPKISAMKIIEKYETFKRGLYSGAIGYIEPNGDFDSSVVIRSLIYNAELKTGSISAGGAITDMADGISEYNECVLKAEAVIKAVVLF